MNPKSKSSPRLDLLSFAVTGCRTFNYAAHCNLGVCYERGCGLAKDLVESYQWLLLAAAPGDKRAKLDVSVLELILSPEQIREGEQWADDWLERHRKLRKIGQRNSGTGSTS